MGWLGELLWSAWAAVSTVASVGFLLAGGAAIFGLFVGLPYSISRYRRSREVDRAIARLPMETRRRVAALDAEFGPFDDAGALLIAAPDLRSTLSGYGVPAEALLDRILRETPGPSATVDDDEEKE